MENVQKKYVDTKQGSNDKKNWFQIRITNSIEEGIVKSMKQINELGR